MSTADTSNFTANIKHTIGNKRHSKSLFQAMFQMNCRRTKQDGD